jgi:hypothetical protein
MIQLTSPDPAIRSRSLLAELSQQILRRHGNQPVISAKVADVERQQMLDPMYAHRRN